MDQYTKCIVFCVSFLLFINGIKAGLVLAPNKPYDPDFNFQNKDAFLKEHIKKLINCIQPPPGSPVPPPAKNPLNKTSIGSPNGKDRFIFAYSGTRQYNETCLGDTYKKDFIRRLYDAVCMEYEDKVKFLDALSCNADQNLECRQVGVEPLRQFAEQATPIMRCLCPDYSKSQAYLSDDTKGFFDKERRQCVLRTGLRCVVTPRHLDARLIWNDFDYDSNNDGKAEGIDVVDLRPQAKTYPCVKHAFCYTNDSRGLKIAEVNRNRCVCEAGHFSGADRECHKGRDASDWKGIILALVMLSIGLLTFIVALLL